MMGTQDYSKHSKAASIIEKDPETLQHGAFEDYILDPSLERRLLQKIDIHVLPLLAIMYLFK